MYRDTWKPSTSRPDDWRDSAACRQVGPAAFFAEPGPGERSANLQALRICRHCPVQAECLEFALDTDQRWGVWGGTTEMQRAEMKGRKRP